MGERLKVLLVLVFATAIVVAYALIPQTLSIGNFEFRKLDMTYLKSILNGEGEPSRDIREAVSTARRGFVNGVDTTHQTVLFFGDSMTKGISLRLADYCNANGHKLYSITWYSSTTKEYASSNILDTYIRRYHPTFFIVCLGSNELFVHDVPVREQYIRAIIRKFGSKPYVWVSPPNWKKDTGLDSLIRRCVGSGRFFDSSQLTFERASDHIHPTDRGAARWTDLIARWMSDPQQAAHPIRMTVPKVPCDSSFYDIYTPQFTGFADGDTPERHRHYNR